MMEFIHERLGQLWTRTGEHLLLVGIATGLAVILGVPLGIGCHHIRRMRGAIMSAVGIMQTVPSLAMLAILLSLIGKIGTLPAIIALVMYALLPIVRNTLTGLESIPAGVLEAAKGVGMTRGQTLRLVELPMALPVIVAGIRTAAVISVGIATLSAFIGAGGLGAFINRGLALDRPPLILLGAIPAAILALLVDGAIWIGQKTLTADTSGEIKGLFSHFLGWLPIGSLIVLTIVTLSIDITPNVSGKERGNSTTATATTGVVRIGSKEFAEQLILGEMMAQIIEAHTHLHVEREFGLGGTMICHQALTAGEIDLYVEYTGTAYRVISEHTDTMGRFATYHQVAADYQKNYDLLWLEPFGFNNTYALTVRAEDARKHNWRTISDLIPSDDTLRAGFTSEFQEREDGYPGLQKSYGLSFASTKDLSATLMCEALAQEEVDIICAFATDGRLEAYNLVTLEDDRRFFPPYDAAPVIRAEVLKRHPEIANALSLLAGRLDDQTMRGLNYEVEALKQAPARVVHNFLQKHGLLVLTATPSAALIFLQPPKKF